MRFSPGARAAIVAVLAITLGSKLWLGRSVSDPPVEPTLRAAAAAMTNAGFTARVIRLARSPNALAEGQRPGCRIVAGVYPPHGTFADIYRELARPVGPLSYAWRGAITADPPGWRALFDYFWWRERARLGLPAAYHPIIAVAATPGCDLARVAWPQTSA